MKKKIFIIISVTLAFCGIAAAVLLLLNNNDKLIEEIKQELYKDIKPEDYGYQLHKETTTKIDGQPDMVIKDVTALYKDFPSVLIEKENEINYKGTLYTVENNLPDFKYCIIDEKFAEEHGFPSVETAFQMQDIDLDLSMYKVKENYKEEMKGMCYIYRTPITNALELRFASSYFETYEEYVQACYDVFYEIVHRLTPEELRERCAALNFCYFDVIDASIENGDYRPLFDGIMNHAIAYVSLEDNIHTRIEFLTETDEDGNTVDVLEVRKAYLLTDEIP